jgi:type IV pilus assembly protein PilA
MLSLRQRIAREEGFTLIELLVVLLIIAILLSIAIPSYLGFQTKAEQTAAMSDVRSAVPDAEAYYSDHISYASMFAGTATTGLKGTYDSGMLVRGVDGSTNGVVSAIPSATNTQRYCISAIDSGHWAHIVGPGGQVQNDITASTNPCSGF